MYDLGVWICVVYYTSHFDFHQLLQLCRLGVNLMNFPASRVAATYAVLFHVGIAAILCFYVLFWLQVCTFHYYWSLSIYICGSLLNSLRLPKICATVSLFFLGIFFTWPFVFPFAVEHLYDAAYPVLLGNFRGICWSQDTIQIEILLTRSIISSW